MINQLKKWLVVSTVNSKLNAFKFTILLFIISMICICSIISLKKQNNQLKEQLNAHVEYIDGIHANILEPLGL